MDLAKGAALMTGTSVVPKVLNGVSDYIPKQTETEIISKAQLLVGNPGFDSSDFETARLFLNTLPEAKRNQAVDRGAKLNGVTKEELIEKPLHTKILPYSIGNRDKLITGSTDVGECQLNRSNRTGCYVFWHRHVHLIGDRISWDAIGRKVSLAAVRTMDLICLYIFDNPGITVKAKKNCLQKTMGSIRAPYRTESTHWMFYKP